MKKFTVFFFALAAFSRAFAGIFLLNGTSSGDTSYDVNKVWKSDDMLCWAAAASNAIKYWQNSHVSEGFELPAGTPCGSYSAPYNSDIFKTFFENWTNAGGYAGNAMQWWFSGEVPIVGAGGSELKPGAEGGGYWNDVFNFKEIGDVFVTFDFFENYTRKDDLKTALDELIAENISMTAAIYTDSGGGHAISVWGYEYDDELGGITGLLISDSDDDYLGNLVVGVEWDEGDSRWYLQEYYGMNNWYLGNITALDLGVEIPEPSLCAAILGAAALALAGCRRPAAARRIAPASGRGTGAFLRGACRIGGLPLGIFAPILLLAVSAVLCRANEKHADLMVRLSKIEVRMEYLEAYNALLKEEILASVKLEPGVLALYAVCDKDAPNKISILEIYESEAAYKRHVESPHFQKYKRETLKMVKSLELKDVSALIPDMKIK